MRKLFFSKMTDLSIINKFIAIMFKEHYFLHVTIVQDLFYPITINAQIEFVHTFLLIFFVASLHLYLIERFCLNIVFYISENVPSLVNIYFS